MRTIVVSIHNGLLSEAITRILLDSGEFTAIQSSKISKSDNAHESCKLISADVALLGVSEADGECFEKRLKEVEKIRKDLPECKVVMLCDENTYPELAKKVVRAKKENIIDNFFYSSITANYLTAALASL